MEKRAFGLGSKALMFLAAAPTVSAGLNWLSGRDPKKKVQRTQAIMAHQQMLQQLRDQQQANPAAQGMVSAANGLHAYRNAAPMGG